MLSFWTPFGFIFRNVVSSSFAQRKAQKKNRRAFRPLFCEESRTLRRQSTSPTHCGSAPGKKMAGVSPSFSARKGSSPQAEYQTGLLCFAGRRSFVVGRKLLTRAHHQEEDPSLLITLFPRESTVCELVNDAMQNRDKPTCTKVIPSAAALTVSCSLIV